MMLKIGLIGDDQEVVPGYLLTVKKQKIKYFEKPAMNWVSSDAESREEYDAIRKNFVNSVFG